MYKYNLSNSVINYFLAQLPDSLQSWWPIASNKLLSLKSKVQEWTILLTSIHFCKVVDGSSGIWIEKGVLLINCTDNLLLKHNVSNSFLGGQILSQQLWSH